MVLVTVADVQVIDRHRTDFGDLQGLADSLRDLGQLQPILLTKDFRLIAGGRRLAAAQSLGWSQIEATVTERLDDAEGLLRAERDENTCRKPFSPTEEHSLYAALLELTTKSGGRPVAKSKPTARDREFAAGAATGNPGRHKSLDKIGELKDLAQDPAVPGHLQSLAREALIEIDRTGNVSGSHKRVAVAKRAAEASRAGGLSGWSEDEITLRKALESGQAIVVSYREHHENLVRWAQGEGLLVGVDRRTEWGNPFEMPHDGDRATVISNYAQHFLPFKPSLQTLLGELRGKALACWCAPKPCHADILRELVSS